MSSHDDIERMIGDALRTDALPGDDDMLAKMIDRALDTPPPTPTWKIAGGSAVAAASAVLLFFSLHHPSEPPAPVPTPVVETIAPPPVVTIDPPKPIETAFVAPPPVVQLPSAAELFKRANDARHAGRDASAMSDYRTLQSTYPNSAEARASLVALGRLLLDKRADYAGALVQFDRYLAKDGSLKEEALIGRALALEHLGRKSEEEAAWHAVLDMYPDSIYAGEAHARLAVLSR